MITLKRSFEEKEKNFQEEFFLNSNNLNFLDHEKTIFNIDKWSIKNLKELIVILKNDDVDDLTLSFKKWNSNLEYIFNNLNFNLLQLSLGKNDNLYKSLNKNDINQALLDFKGSSEEEKYQLFFNFLEDNFNLEFALKLNQTLNHNIFNQLNLFYLFITSKLEKEL